jgi:hypothetical protein
MKHLWDKIGHKNWNSAFMCSTYKKEAEKDCNNYICISVINSTERVLSRVIKNKIQNMTKAKISEE